MFLLYDYYKGRGDDRSADNERSAGRPANKKAELDLIDDILQYCHAIPVGSEVDEDHYLIFLNLVLRHYEVVSANFIWLYVQV